MLFARFGFILFAAALSTAQSQPPPAKPSSPKPVTETPKAGAVAVDPGELPVSLDRIQRALAKTPRLQFDTENRPVFRLQVFGEKPTIEEILGADFGSGPVPYASMSHQEFLNLVTPKDAQGYAAFTNKEGATVAATSFLLQWTLQRALLKYRETTDARAREAARQEVLEALNALEEARAKAGLPKK